MFNHTGKKIESVAWHPNGQYIAHAGHDPYIYVYRIADILAFNDDAIPVAHKTWAGDHAEYIDFNADGSFLCSAHQKRADQTLGVDGRRLSYQRKAPRLGEATTERR